MSRAAKRFVLVALMLVGAALAQQAWIGDPPAQAAEQNSAPAVPMLAALQARQSTDLPDGAETGLASQAWTPSLMAYLPSLPGTSSDLPEPPAPAPAFPAELTAHGGDAVSLAPAERSAPRAQATPAPVERPAPRSYTMRMRVTAYCACPRCCGQHADGITASGRPVTFNGGRFVAADTRLLPFNTRLSVPGYNNGQPVPVLDRGKAIKGHRLDVFFPDHQTALEWGSRMVDVTVYVAP